MPSLRNIHKLLDPEIRAKNLRALRWALRGLWWNVMRPEVPDPVFVVGCSRSGTTITYETLAAAPQFLSFGWEIPQFWDGLYGPLTNNWESEAAGTRHALPGHRDAAFRYSYQHLGAGWVLDKSCINVMRIPYLHALFPRARFVFIQRDGRDNISSMMDGWRMGRTDGRFELSQFFGPVSGAGGHRARALQGVGVLLLAPGWRQYNHASLAEACAFQWISANRLALDAKAGVPPETVDPAALRGHLRAPRGDVPRRLRATGVLGSRSTSSAVRQLAAHQRGQGHAQAAEVEGAQPRGHQKRSCR